MKRTCLYLYGRLKMFQFEKNNKIHNIQESILQRDKKCHTSEKNMLFFYCCPRWAQSDKCNMMCEHMNTHLIPMLTKSIGRTNGPEQKLNVFLFTNEHAYGYHPWNKYHRDCYLWNKINDLFLLNVEMKLDLSYATFCAS